MNQSLVDRRVRAVLYEGYLLYPYRPSVKNRRRWTFGAICPRAYSLARGGSEAWSMRTECLVRGSPATALCVTVRFLGLLARQTDDWQEATERTVGPEECGLAEILSRPRERWFSFPGVDGSVELSAEQLEAELFRLRVRILNRTELPDAERFSRDEVILRSLVSTHTVLEARGGSFVSLTDPPEEWRSAAAGCRNEGCWPVLVGEPGATDAVLSSPIILPDYPQVAPESPGDLFDATEIDEILTLRILTLTDEEKVAMATLDERGRALLERTQALARDQMLGLHGTIRGLRPVSDGGRS
jgi:hydrogenase maturation protease